MFPAHLKCENCGFATEEFIAAYYPPGDVTYFVFQNRETWQFRIVPTYGIAARTHRKRPTEKQLDDVCDQLLKRIQRPDEDQVGVSNAVCSSQEYKCPECLQDSVVVRLLAII